MNTFATESNEDSKQEVIQVLKNFTYVSSAREELNKAKVDAVFEKVLSEKRGEDRIAVMALMGYANLLGADEEKAKRLAADPKTVGKMIELLNR